MWLIAEDEADIRNLMELLCRTWGYETLAFEDGQQIWDWLSDVEAGNYTGPIPEFALMDIRMPGKKGHEVAYRIRTVPDLQHIPIVLMTAFALDQDQKNAMINNGVDHIIHKPLPDFDKLYALLHAVIQNKQT